MTRKVRSFILAGVVGIGGLLGAEAKAHDYGGYGPGIAVGEPYGGGYGGYPGYGYGGGYSRPSTSTYSYTKTTVTTIIYCDRCGHRHDKYAPCGGYGGGYGRGYRRGYGGGYPGRYPW
jgi:hypothetical protein